MKRCLEHKVEQHEWRFQLAVNPMDVLVVEWIKLGDLLRKVGDSKNLIKHNCA